ncbi:MAG: hypothetical protein L0Y72_25745 [Gemmataceae bacterium]|nr:hypothetical protein [Gemmataceae bacterium]MCI0742451.1 hypothetical protein [Gemmataceae bacterium]
MLSCQEASYLVSESLDRKLRLWQRIKVRLHLLMCRLCSRFRKQTLFLRDAARYYLMGAEESETAVDIGLSPEARDRIKRSLQSDPS